MWADLVAAAAVGLLIDSREGRLGIKGGDETPQTAAGAGVGV